MSEERTEKPAAKPEAEPAKAASEAPKAKAAETMDWQDVLEESSAWQLLAAEADITITDEGITGPVGMDNALAARVANAAEILLEGKVHRVVTSTQPSLRVVVEE